MFDRDKIAKSVELALRKRPVDIDTKEKLISGIFWVQYFSKKNSRNNFQYRTQPKFKLYINKTRMAPPLGGVS